MNRTYLAIVLVVGALLLIIRSLAAASPVETGSAAMSAGSSTWLFVAGPLALGAWLWMAGTSRES